MKQLRKFSGRRDRDEKEWSGNDAGSAPPHGCDRDKAERLLRDAQSTPDAERRAGSFAGTGREGAHRTCVFPFAERMSGAAQDVQ